MTSDHRSTARAGAGSAAETLDRGEWNHRELGEVLERRAESAYRAVDYRDAVDLYEEAFRAHREDDDRLGAGRAARILAWFHGTVYGDWAVSSGWMARARMLLDEAGDDSAEHGWVLMLQRSDPRRLSWPQPVRAHWIMARTMSRLSPASGIRAGRVGSRPG